MLLTATFPKFEICFSNSAFLFKEGYFSRFHFIFGDLACMWCLQIVTKVKVVVNLVVL